MEEEDVEVYDDAPKLPVDSQMAADIFARENVDGILERGIGTFHAMNFIRKMFPRIPMACSVRDILFLIDSVATEGDFIEETFMTFFLECLTIARQEVEGGEEDADEEEFAVTQEFIADRLSDLQPLEGSDFSFNFTSFLVQNAEITNIDAIVGFEAIQTVSLKRNLVTDLTPLSRLPRIKRIDLSENKVKTISGLAFPTLESLVLTGNKLVCIESLDAPRLKSLDVSSNRIFFIAPLAFCRSPALETVNLSANNIKEFKEQCLAGLAKLKTLKMSGNGFRKIVNAICADLVSLTDLDISDCPLVSLTGLQQCRELEVLDVHKTGLEQPVDFLLLAGCRKLKHLYTYESPVAEFENVRIKLIHILPGLEEINEEAVTAADRQESEDFFNERAMEEQRMIDESHLAGQGENEEEQLGEETAHEFDVSVDETRALPGG